MLDRLQDSYSPIPLNEIRRFEQEFSITLPEDYVKFLGEYNAARAKHPISFRVRYPGPFVSRGGFDRTFGIVNVEEERSASDLREYIDVFEGRIPEGTLAIAMSVSDPILLSLRPADFGSLYLWDREEEGSDDNSYLIAESFTQFLGCLYPGEEYAPYREKLPEFQAVERGEFDEVLDYLKQGGEVNARNHKGWTLLACAARNSWPRIVQLLLHAGADPEAPDLKYRTPVYRAAMAQSIDCLKLLVQAVASPEYRDSKGRTLIQIAEHESYYRVARFLKTVTDSR